MIHALMIGLVERAGGPEAAARMIAARLGDPGDKIVEATRKGTISRRISGSLTWPLDEVLALEDALGDYRVRNWLGQTLPTPEPDASLIQVLADASRETGEATSAVMDLIAKRGTREAARKEVAEGLLFFQQLLACLEGDDLPAPSSVPPMPRT